jgi:hypothetical protein
MAVDLNDLIDPLKRTISPPDEDLYPNVTSTMWVGYLADAFWSARIEAGLFTGFYVNEDDEIVPDDPAADDLERDYQQIVVLYAGLNIILQSIRNTNTLFRAKAGPAEFETQNSATALKAILDEWIKKRDMILSRLSDLGATTDFIIDLSTTANDVLIYGDSYWMR